MRDAGVWSFKEILDTPDEDMHEIIRPSGYYKAKTRKLKEFAEFILSKHDGDLERLFALPIDEMRDATAFGLGNWRGDSG